jgi:hypothetical protein
MAVRCSAISLNFNIIAPRAGSNVNMYGPMLAATFRF